MSWLPGALKDLLKHVPTLLFEVVDWKAMREVLPQLTQRLLTGTGVTSAREGLVNDLPRSLRLAEWSTRNDLTEQQKISLGGVLLELFFTEALSGQPIFLDLRTHHFSPLGEEWQWKTSNLWGQFSRTFTEGLRKLYAGFFHHDEASFRKGLELTGLVSPEWSEESKLEMTQLLKDTFAIGGGDAPLHFNLVAFQQSFQKVFDFMMSKKGRLGPDFVLLGIMLVTLYQSLEELGAPHAVTPFYDKAAARLGHVRTT